jgi:hypothetical protein
VYHAIWQTRTRPSRWLILPGLHLIACIAIIATSHGGGWDYYPLMWIDFPVDMVMTKIFAALSNFLVFTVAGTLWWLGVNVGFMVLYRKMAD